MLCDYPARNGQRLSSDYRATIQRLLRGKSRTEVFPNFPKTFQKPDQNFFKTVRKIERFFCAADEGLSRARGLGAGWLGRLGDGRQPPGGRDLPSAGTGSGPGASRAAQGLGGAVQVIRGRRSGARRAAGLAVRRAAAAADAAVSLPLWSGGLCRGHCAVTAAMPLRGAYAVAVAFLWRGIGIYTLSHKKRSEGVLEALRAIDTYAHIFGRRRRTRKSPAGHTSGRGKKKAAHTGRQRGLRVAGDPDQDQGGQQQGVGDDHMRPPQPMIKSYGARRRYSAKKASSVHGARSACTASRVSSSIQDAISSIPNAAIASAGVQLLRSLLMLIYAMVYSLSPRL